MAKINKDTEDIYNIINKVDLMDIHKELYTLLIQNIPSFQTHTWDIHKNLIIYSDHKESIIKFHKKKYYKPHSDCSRTKNNCRRKPRDSSIWKLKNERKQQ